MKPHTLLLVFAILTAGCESSRNEKITVRREVEPEADTDPFRPRPVLGIDHSRPQFPGQPRGRRGEDIDAEVLRAEVARLVSVDLERSGSRIKATREAVRKVLDAVPDDPWVVEERERKAVLFRRWADIATPLPEAPEPEPAAPAEDGGGDEDEGGDDE